MTTVDEKVTTENEQKVGKKGVRKAIDNFGPAFKSAAPFTAAGLLIGLALILLGDWLQGSTSFAQVVGEKLGHIIGTVFEHLGVGFFVSALAVFFYEWDAHIKEAQNLSHKLANIIDRRLIPVFDTIGDDQFKHSLELLILRTQQTTPEYLPDLMNRLIRLAKAISDIQHDNAWARNQYIDFISYLLEEVVVENADTLKNVSEQKVEQQGEYQFRVPPTGGEMADKILASHMKALSAGDGYDVISHLSSWKHLKTFHKETEAAVKDRQIQVRRVFNLERKYKVELSSPEVTKVLTDHLKNMGAWGINEIGEPRYGVRILGKTQLIGSSSNLRDNIDQKHFGIFKYSTQNGKMSLRVNVHKPDLSDMRLSKYKNVINDDIELFEEAWKFAKPLTLELIGEIAQQMSLSETRSIEYRESIAEFKKLREKLNPFLDKVFGEHFSKEIGNIVEALESNKITLHNTDEFRSYYGETLRQFPTAEFWATSIPSRAFFWDPAIENVIAEFIKGGGRMKRIFFLKGPEEANEPEVMAIISRQIEIGVEVYTADSSQMHSFYDLFFVDSQGRFAWKVTERSNQITQVVGTADSKEIEVYKDNFEKLRRISRFHQEVFPS